MRLPIAESARSTTLNLDVRGRHADESTAYENTVYEATVEEATVYKNQVVSVARHRDDWGLLQMAHAFEQASGTERRWPTEN